MLRMLIVEDERWEREGLTDFLDWNSLGIELSGLACDGIEGLEQARAIRPDIIITDIKMPGMDGLKMSGKVQEFLPDVKTIILTGYDDFKLAQEAINIKANAYILKPVEENDLLEVIKKVTDECINNKKRQEENNKILKLLDETSKKAANLIPLDSLNAKINVEELSHIESKSNKDDSMVKKVEQLIAAGYNSNISLKTIAVEIYISPNYLGSIFKKNTGLSFNDYLCRVRMEKARELLQSPKNNVSCVARKVGIPNTSYFCILFKNAYGVAPGEFQESVFHNF